ncbi:MAG: biotin-dependent carboxyltransferase family protein [Lachnospiraceae bacterium]|nr:biotin-dependent carboxyltransferase family protein [Lachnospiraceae bacterium]
MGIKVVNGGFLTTIQDMGRYGFQETGLAVSGVMDTRSAALANLLVGNDENEAVIEITMVGPMLEFTQDIWIAVTGGDLGAKLDGQPVPRYEAVFVRDGQTLSFSGMFGGSRAYIAFAGGLDIPVVMGSRSTNLKAKIGGLEGRKLRAGDSIGFAAPKTWLPAQTERRLKPDDFSAKELTLRVLMGPQDDCFTDDGIWTFLESTYTVSNEYDRMGCRMQGPVIEHKNGGDIITDGISFGAVQVPSHGNPIVMMADHQTTGGYTKIANVISVDLPKLAQCMPGIRIRFKKVGIEEAQTLYCEWRTEVLALSKRFAAKAEPAGELQAAAMAAAMNEHKNSWCNEGVYRVVVNGEVFEIELSKETARFR